MGETGVISETRAARLLGELAELSMDLARDLQARAKAAETAEDATALAGAFHRIARGVRQTLALEARLERDGRAQARAELAEAQRATPAQIQRRRDQVQGAVVRAVWDEAEGDEAEDLLEMLDMVLDDLMITDDFMVGPVGEQVARLCRDLGLSGSGRPRAGRRPRPDEGVDWSFEEAAPDSS